MHNGLIRLRLVANRFNDSEDPHGDFEAWLERNGYGSSGLLLFLYASDDLDDDERALLETELYRGTPTWADALLLEPTTPMPDPRSVIEGRRIIAYWGVKGGVGRTTALAHTATLLSRSGKKVLAVDLDLDSPALVARLCKPGQADNARIDHLLVSFQNNLDESELERLVYESVVIASPHSYNVHLLGQGHADAEFVKALTGPLTPASLYNKKPLLRDVIRMAAEAADADIVLLDVRSGFCEESAVSLLDLADEVFVFRSAFPQ